jgi:hypothetical protein
VPVPVRVRVRVCVCACVCVAARGCGGHARLTWIRGGPCGSFHATCIREALRRSTACPLCRANVTDALV